jgi:hypothetical protein
LRRSTRYLPDLASGLGKRASKRFSAARRYRRKLHVRILKAWNLFAGCASDHV